MHLLLENWMVLICKTLTFLPKDAICPVWLKLALCDSGQEDFVNVFSLFRNYLPLEKDRAPHLNKLDSPSPKNALCELSLVNIGSVVPEKMEMWKLYRQIYIRQMNDRRSESLTGGSSSGQLKRHEFFFPFKICMLTIYFLGLGLHSIFLAWHSRFYLNYMTFMCNTIYAVHKRYMYHDQIIINRCTWHNLLYA